MGQDSRTKIHIVTVYHAKRSIPEKKQMEWFKRNASKRLMILSIILAIDFFRTKIPRKLKVHANDHWAGLLVLLEGKKRAFSKNIP